MYVTTRKNDDAEFDWEFYFQKDHEKNLKAEATDILLKIRSLVKEDKVRMTFSAGRLIRTLMNKYTIKENPSILELGAATGFLSRWLVNSYDGKALLVDRGENSYKRFLDYKDNNNLSYLREDIFNLDLKEQYDIVCSFGLLEHFKDKKEVLEVHKKYLKKGGHLLILVPKDSYLTKIYFESHPELNQGYRELLTESEMVDIMKDNGLHVLEVDSSDGYVYDFVGILCTID